MGISVNLQQVESIIANLKNTVKKDHVGALNNDGGVTQTTSSWNQRVCHYFKTLFNNSAVVQENRAMLHSYKAMLSKNIGDAYSTIFSNRMSKVEKSGSYKIGKDLSRELKSIINQYNVDLNDNAKAQDSLQRAHNLTDSEKFNGIFKERFDLCLKSRQIPNDDEGMRFLRMDVDATRLFRAQAQDFILRNDREPDEGEINAMLNKPLQEVFKDVNRKNCELLCSTYKFIDKGSNESMDVKLQSALAAKGINMDVPAKYVETLIGEVKEIMRNYSTYVKKSDVKDIISDVIKYAVEPGFIDKNIDKILVKNMVSANVSPKMHGTLLDTTNMLSDVIQRLSKESISTDGLKITLQDVCSRFSQTCNALSPASRPSQEQQNAIFSAAAKSATECCLLDTQEMLETRNLLLNHSNTLVGAGSPFITNMYVLSNGILANTDPDAAKMLTFCRSMVSTLNEAITSASGKIEPSQAEIGNNLVAKKKELAGSIELINKHMWENPTQRSRGQKGSNQDKMNQAIELLEQAKSNALASPEATQEQKNEYIAKLDAELNEIRKMAPNRILDFGTEQSAVKLYQIDIDDLQNTISALENKVIAIKKKKNDEGGELVPTEATLVRLHQELRVKQNAFALATDKLEKMYIKDFTTYLDNTKKEGGDIQQNIADVKDQIDEITNVQDVIKTRVASLRALPDNNENVQLELDANVTALQLSLQTLFAKTKEIAELTQKMESHDLKLQEAYGLQEGIGTLQKEISTLQKQQEMQPMSAEDRAKNSTEITYLSTGKEFGGLLDYVTYKNINNAIPVHNDVGLTQQEKVSFMQFMDSVVTKKVTDDDSVGTRLNKRIAELNSKAVLKPGASEKEKAESARAQKDLQRLTETKERSLFMATQHYSPTFLKNFENGLHLNVNGNAITGPDADGSDSNKEISYNALSNMFESREIAGKVLSPFTLDTFDKLFNALAGSEKEFLKAGISDNVLDYHLFGDPVSSIDELQVNKLDNGQYTVTCYASSQKDNGTYAHHMFNFKVSDLDRAVPTYTIDDVDVMYHVESSSTNAVPKGENNVIAGAQNNPNLSDPRLVDKKQTLTNLMQAEVVHAYTNQSPQIQQALTRFLVDMTDLDAITSMEVLQTSVDDAMLFAQDNPDLLAKVKPLAPMNVSTENLQGHAQHITEKLQELCLEICTPNDDDVRPHLDAQGFYDLSLKDCSRDLPVIAGVRVVSGQPVDVRVQDFKDKMLKFSKNQEEREVLSILLSQDHLRIPGGMLMGVPANLPLGEPLQPGSPLRLESNNGNDEIRYQLERNGAGDAIVHISMGIRCVGILDAVVYTPTGVEADTKLGHLIGTLKYDVLVPHNQFGLLEAQQGVPPVILTENMRIEPAV